MYNYRAKPYHAWTLYSVAAVLSMISLFAQGCFAATIKVNTVQDAVAIDGFCSLREAITSVNTQAASGNMSGECAAGDGNNDTINVPAGLYLLTLVGDRENNNATGDLDILANVTIAGAGVGATIIDASGLGSTPDRVFDVPASSIRVTLRDMTVQNGHAPNINGGLCAENGGGIRINNAAVTLTDFNLDSNLAGNGSIPLSCNPGRGGGIFTNGGSLILLRADVTRNFSSTLGGGLHSQGANVEVIRSRFDSNSAQAAGGGISISSAALVMTQSSVSRNTAVDACGGGIYDDAAGLTVSNSTIVANTAGGGCATVSFASGISVEYANAQLDFVTVSENTSGGISIYSQSNNLKSLNLRNSIISGNGGSSDCFMFSGGSLISQGYNLAGSSCPSNGPGDIVTTNPLLGPLSSYGGPAELMLPHPDSPATNAGSCGASDLFEDQRGDTRPASVPNVPYLYDGCDIGAAELDDDVFWDGFGR
jgi:CSLREA domain-containing protein